MISNQFVSGFESQSRLKRLVIMPFGDIRANYGPDIVRWHESFSLSLVERALVRLSLKGTGTLSEIAQVWQEAYINTGWVQPPMDLSQYTYGTSILGRVMDMWTHPPYDDPSLIIYSADVSRYVDDAMVIEVQYRHALPT
jgi:hypothetical protein